MASPADPSPSCLDLFATSLAGQVEPQDRRVCHLFLTDRQRMRMEHPPAPGQDRQQWLRAAMRSVSVLTCAPSDILRVLSVVGPTLQTLTLLLFCRYGEPIFSDLLRFPQLRDLTIHGSTLCNSTCSIPSTPPPKCPSLRHLHVVQDLQLGRALAQSVASLSSPNLTHLRLSRVRQEPALLSTNIVRDLECMLEPEDPVQPSFGLRLPRTLTRVLVQMTHRAQLKDLAMRDPQRRIVLLKPEKRAKEETLLEGKLDVLFYIGTRAAWEQGIGGAEDAVWDVGPSEILASYGYCAEE
ncbi:hypothetical protein GSI_07537 [Ganoderma sinense ZZ0214-1]|uniref:Uncharacterized protein n=1 Tax=Ganoderma sinense ZZ0214-1 TaxID=1077348 RepID=A0A2G8S9C2_9APHY|nr:hypothetical protein GSI_07537 [Ganoderma sinense ZZ0214-1]